MYKFKENIILDDVKRYIDETYRSHYSTTHKQATEIIIDQGHGEGFCMGNILKYAQRYGKKEGKNKEDLLKYDIGKWNDNELRNPAAEKLNNPND
jgi:hypothetical protein